MTKFSHSFRQSREYSKAYYDNLCAEFTPLYLDALPSDNLVSIDFGKQDMRGAPSIAVFDDRHCVSYQRHFSTYAEMRAYMQGFIAHATGRM